MYLAIYTVPSFVIFSVWLPYHIHLIGLLTEQIFHYRDYIAIPDTDSFEQGIVYYTWVLSRLICYGIHKLVHCVGRAKLDVMRQIAAFENTILEKLVDVRLHHE
jgi:hypothetical protein